VKVLVVVEDDPDVQFLVETIFSMDCRFTLAGVVAAAEDGLEMARTSEPGIIVLDHGLFGQLTGLDAVSTTNVYLHADMNQKERAIARLTPLASTPGRYRPPDALIAFLEAL
jgi:response regulator of citrate/malate metabolism